MIRIAVANQKGGVGKTTTAVYLSAVAGGGKRSVALVDSDPQGSAADWLEHAAEGRQFVGEPGDAERRMSQHAGGDASLFDL